MTRHPLVLIVDDDAPIARLLGDVVKDAFDVETVVARDGMEAVELAQKLHPSVILLDLLLPDISGVEVCRQLRASPSTRDRPIVVITGLADVGGARERAIEAGCTHFVHKLYSFHHLLPVLASCLEESGELAQP